MPPYGFNIAEVLIASQAFSTFLSLWNNEKLRTIILKNAIAAAFTSNTVKNKLKKELNLE